MIKNEKVRFNSIDDVIDKLSQMGFNLQITTGSKDVVNGYGWHVVYFVKIYKREIFCHKCQVQKYVPEFKNLKHENCSWIGGGVDILIFDRVFEWKEEMLDWFFVNFDNIKLQEEHIRKFYQYNTFNYERGNIVK